MHCCNRILGIFITMCPWLLLVDDALGDNGRCAGGGGGIIMGIIIMGCCCCCCVLLLELASPRCFFVFDFGIANVWDDLTLSRGKGSLPTVLTHNAWRQNERAKMNDILIASHDIPITSQ